MSLIFIGLLILVSTCITDDGDTYKKYFIKYYGMDGDHEAADMAVNADGTIVLLGTIEFPANSGIKRIYLVKVGEQGNTLWEKVLGGSSENAKDIEPISFGTYAGGYLITTNTFNVLGIPVFKVLRLGSDGNKIDSVVFEQYESQFSNSITSLADGGFIVTGNTADTSALPSETIEPLVDLQDLISVRFDEGRTINPLWKGPFGGESRVMGVKIIEGAANEFYFAGFSDKKAFTGDTNNDYNFWFTALSANGDPLADFHSSQNQNEILSGIAKSPSGIFLAVGTLTNGTNPSKLYAATINSNFTSIDNEGTTISIDDLEGVAVCSSGVGEFLVLGNKIEPGGRNIWIAKVDRNLTAEFELIFGGANNDDTGSTVAELPNGDIVILGTMNLVNQNKIALIKLNANGEF